MIRVVVRYGRGYKRAYVVNEPLLSDPTAAQRRAEQDLASHNYIVVGKTVTVPHDPAEQLCGTETSDLTFGTLGIFGIHTVTGRTITLSRSSATESVTLEQYRELG